MVPGTRPSASSSDAPRFERLRPSPRVHRSDQVRTGVGIRRASAEHEGTPFDPYRSGLHHVCFRARSREDVDRIHDFAVEIGAYIVHPPREDDWAIGYYSVLFEDPGGLRLEVNFVPGKGNLDPSVELPLPAEIQRRLSEP